MTKRHATARRNDVPSAKTPFTKKKVLKTLPKMVPTEYTKALRWSKRLNSKTDMGNERAPLNKPVSVKLPTLTKISECLARETKVSIFYPSTNVYSHLCSGILFFSTTSSGTPCYQSFHFSCLFLGALSFVCHQVTRNHGTISRSLIHLLRLVFLLPQPQQGNIPTKPLPGRVILACLNHPETRQS